MAQELGPLYELEVQCLICQHPFTSKKVRARFKRAIFTDSDFYSIYEDERYNPILYYVLVCPNCGFAFTKETEKRITKAHIQKFTEVISSNWRKRDDFSHERSEKLAIEAYKLALLSAKLLEERPIALAGIVMRLMWLYRKQQNQDEELRFMSYAVEAYEKSYYYNDYENSSMSEAKLIYLLGELNRRLGNTTKAISYFSMLIHSKDEITEKKLVEMARDQWGEIRKEQKNTQNC